MGWALGGGGLTGVRGGGGWEEDFRGADDVDAGRGGEGGERGCCDEGVEDVDGEADAGGALGKGVGGAEVGDGGARWEGEGGAPCEGERGKDVDGWGG